jgi:hypothetical protein
MMVEESSLLFGSKFGIGYKSVEDNLLHEQPLRWRAANWDYGVEQCREHCWPAILFPKLRPLIA